MLSTSNKLLEVQSGRRQLAILDRINSGNELFVAEDVAHDEPSAFPALHPDSTLALKKSPLTGKNSLRRAIAVILPLPNGKSGSWLAESVVLQATSSSP